MRNLAFDDFDGKIGTAYDVLVGDGALPVTLTELQKLAESGREGGSFRLEFLGPTDPVLPQAIYPFRQDSDEAEIFIVPVARDGKGTLYEAIFF